MLRLKKTVVLNQLLIAVNLIGIILNALGQKSCETILQIAHLTVKVTCVTVCCQCHTDLVLKFIGLFIEHLGVIIELLESVVVGCSGKELVSALSVYHNLYIAALQIELAASDCVIHIECDNCHLCGIGLTLE